MLPRTEWSKFSVLTNPLGSNEQPRLENSANFAAKVYFSERTWLFRSENARLLAVAVLHHAEELALLHVQRHLRSSTPRPPLLEATGVRFELASSRAVTCGPIALSSFSFFSAGFSISPLNTVAAEKR